MRRDNGSTILDCTAMIFGPIVNESINLPLAGQIIMTEAVFLV